MRRNVTFRRALMAPILISLMAFGGTAGASPLAWGDSFPFPTPFPWPRPPMEEPEEADEATYSCDEATRNTWTIISSLARQPVLSLAGPLAELAINRICGPGNVPTIGETIEIAHEAANDVVDHELRQEVVQGLVNLQKRLEYEPRKPWEAHDLFDIADELEYAASLRRYSILPALATLAALKIANLQLYLEYTQDARTPEEAQAFLEDEVLDSLAFLDAKVEEIGSNMTASMSAERTLYRCPGQGPGAPQCANYEIEVDVMSNRDSATGKAKLLWSDAWGCSSEYDDNCARRWDEAKPMMAAKVEAALESRKDRLKTKLLPPKNYWRLRNDLIELVTPGSRPTPSPDPNPGPGRGRPGPDAPCPFPRPTM